MKNGKKFIRTFCDRLFDYLLHLISLFCICFLRIKDLISKHLKLIFLVLESMDLLLATQQYVNEMIRLAGPGMKVMLMDKETVSLIFILFDDSVIG